MYALLESLIQLFWAVWSVLASIGLLILPVVPLLLWVGFWTFAVDWVKLRGFFIKGGWIGLLLLSLMAVLVWGVVAPPADGAHYILGKELSNFVGKTVYVTGLVCIMLLSGSVQLAGVFGKQGAPQPPDSLEGDSGH
ncbi:MAG: hypothetical protein HUJ26_20900 [Planctomycetaceae bacterium]|nr:hypothetical protein [Planctomycetaceae bacterium]